MLIPKSILQIINGFARVNECASKKILYVVGFSVRWRAADVAQLKRATLQGLTISRMKLEM
jgi:hypothetical protein